MIAKLRSILTRRDKQYLAGLLLFSVFVSAMETVGIGIIMPYIQLASDFTYIESNQYLNMLYSQLEFQTPLTFVVAIGICLILFYIIRSGINIFFQYMMVRFAQRRYHLLAYRLFQNYLGMPYKKFVNMNSSYLTKSIITEAQTLTGLIQSVLLFVSEMFVLLFIYAMLLVVNMKVTLLLTVILMVKIFLLKVTVSSKIKIQGVKRAAFQKNFYEIVGASFGNFKLIKLMGNETQVLKKFAHSSLGYVEANTINGTLQHIPRFLLEAIGFGLMIFVMVYLMLKYQTDIKSAIPLLSIYVLALYRLLPSVNRIITAYNTMMFAHKSLDIVHAELNYAIEDLDTKSISFKRDICLDSIDFSFEKNKPLFQNLSLEIKKGEKVAFIGESGAGKSTLVDIVIGLYKPIDGKILVDGELLDETNVRAWRQKIGYIPQNIYLFDGTVGDNIAFGREADEDQIIAALKKANIWDFLKTKEGLDTRVGEGGIILSGGQKQRIAIARALYGDPEILVLDEATSALDNETETKIMDEIYETSKDRTLLVIAHRLSTIKKCDRILKIEEGKIVDSA